MRHFWNALSGCVHAVAQSIAGGAHGWYGLGRWAEKTVQVGFIVGILFYLSVDAFGVTNASLSDDDLLQIRFDQKSGAHISPELEFTDDHGNLIHLGDYFGRKPVVLLMGYYGCPMLCTLVLNGAVDGLREIKQRPGNDYDVVFVSIDPAETPKLAAEKKKASVREYGRTGTENGWHFLTGDKTSIQQLANETGFRFGYDPASKQFAHPSGIIILAPDGKISRYFFGVTFTPKELVAAFKDAKAETVASPAGPLAFLCFHYSPPRGRYGRIVMATVQLGGVATIVGLSTLFLLPAKKNGNGRRAARSWKSWL